MDRAPIYEQIAQWVRQEVLDGRLRPGDMLPTVREMAERWGCTPGTAQQAYKTLAQQGLAVTRPGQGARIGSLLPPAPPDTTPLRRAALVHQAETFLLDALAAGYTLAEAETAVRAAMDRWRALSAETPIGPAQVLRFAGSHDPAVSLIAARFGEITPDSALSVTFTGSLGGLIALAEGKADIAGSHLWDAESDDYNRPFVRRLLPGRRVALLALAHRRLGLLVPRGNPAALMALEDLARPGLRFVNRQRGTGTRVWLEAQLARRGLDIAGVTGTELLASTPSLRKPPVVQASAGRGKPPAREAKPGRASEAKRGQAQAGPSGATHMQVAQAVAEGSADVGLGIETAALAYGIGFVPLTVERYDFVVPQEAWQLPALQAFARWLTTDPARVLIGDLGGYDTSVSGEVIWVSE